MNAPPSSPSSSFFGNKLTLRHFLTRRRVATVALVALAVLTWTQRQQLFGSEAKSGTKSNPVANPLLVETTTVTVADRYQTQVDFTGRVEARRTTDLSFELNGKVESIAVDEGDAVTAGQVIARLDTALLQTQRTKAAAELAEAQAELDEMIAGPRVEDIAEARAMVAAAEAAFQRFDEEQQRKDGLHERGVATLKERNDARNDAAQAAAELQAARERLAELVAGTRKEKLAAQRGAVAALSAELENIAVSISKSTLHAPFAGRITRRLIDDGTVVNAGQVLTRLVEADQLELHVGVPVDIVAELAIGDEQTVIIRNQAYTGTILSVIAEVDDRTRTRKVMVTLPSDAAASVVSGEVGFLRSQRTVKANGFWVPLESLVRSSRGLWACYAVISKDDAANLLVEKRDLELIYSDGARAFVEGLLNDGDRIVISAVHRLSPGQVVSTQ